MFSGFSQPDPAGGRPYHPFITPTPPPTTQLPDRFRLGPWRVDVSRDEVAGEDQLHKLEPRAMRLLAVLAQAGELYFNLHTKAHTYYGEMRGQIYSVKE